MASSDDDSSTYISDDDFYQDGYRNLTKEEEIEYFRALEETEGFDVPDFGNNIFAFGIITPIRLHDKLSLLGEIRTSASEAIKHYNSENGTDFEVCRYREGESWRDMWVNVLHHF
ncbi:uncharacterized protein LOC111786484 [Cucurbita pepo subsp. pepo]|uniref:uncharacterized protein LOC111786484 n=1 Tax=Cucurbita pepo subsp. pepo TaxID=3664 RepID=UPI000C9D866D|nr:uncharacterized protein LOC111786484 [Cucurbita pepo subsp. pepo]